MVVLISVATRFATRATRRRMVAALAFATALAGANPALADDLRAALARAYAGNPNLQIARANQRAVDEGVPIARARGLPSLSSTATFTEFLKQGPNAFLAPDRLVDVQATLNVPVYSGGAVRNSVNAAKERVRAGQQDLRATESNVFTQVVSAYLGVIAAEAVTGLNAKQVSVLETNLKATTDRFEIGDLTRTDVAQSDSRLALARGNFLTSQANLIAARETYIQVTGEAPGTLAPPPPLPPLPATPDEAVAYALDHNPDLAAARERSKAARFESKAAGAGRLPVISLYTTGDYTDYLKSLGGGAAPSANFAQKQTTAQAGVRASIPLFQGGLPAAQERQAQAREAATLDQEIGVERQIIAGVRSAFSQWRSANEVIVTSQTAVDAAQLSLEGVRAENSVGNRTILDILNAEQELLSAQVQLITARRNAYVAGFNLLATIGRAQASELGLDGGALYDPQTNYDRVKGKFLDFEHDRAPVADATHTVAVPAQDAKIGDDAAAPSR